MEMDQILGVLGGIALAVAFFWILSRFRRKRANEPAREEPYGESSREEPEQEVGRFVEPAADPVMTEEQLRADLAKAQTAQEFYAVYSEADTGSGIEREAINGMLAAVRKDIADATSVRECELALEPIDGRELIGADAVRKEAFEKILSLTTSASDVRELYDSYTNQYNDETFANRIAERFVELARVELAKAATFDDCMDLIDNTLPSDAIGSSDDVVNDAYDKALTLVSTTEEALEFYDQYQGYDDEDEFPDQILRRALELAQDADDAAEVCEQAESGSELERQSALRQIELSTTVEECQSIWDNLGIDHEYGQKAIVRAASIISSSGANGTSEPQAS